MKDKTIERILLAIGVCSFLCLFLFIGLVLTSPTHAAESEERCKPIIQTVYADKTRTITEQVVITKIVKVEIPVYETATVTSDPKVIRKMMKVTHDRYVALLAKYRELKKAK